MTSSQPGKRLKVTEGTTYFKWVAKQVAILSTMSASAPTVSVIIPARDAAGTVADAIHSVLAQDYSGLVEVVVAAGDVATEMAARERGDDPRVDVIANHGGSTPVALNRALEASTGAIVVRCDAHARLPPGYVSRAVAAMEASGAVNVGGRQVPVGDSPFGRAVALAMVSPIGAGDARYRIGGSAGPVDTVYLGVFRRKAVEAVGGFDETLARNQDYELNWRLRDAGGVVWFDPGLAVEYRPRDSVRALGRQYFEYGRWKREVLRRHPESRRWRQLAAPLLVAGLAASLAAAPLSWRAASLLPAAYVATTVGTGLRDWARTGEAAALMEPAALWTMHLAWGAGFILGPPDRP